MSNKNKLKHQAEEDILKNQEGDVDTQATVDNEANAEVSEEQKETEEVEASIMKELGMPCFIKASRSGSSVGCYRCDKAEDLIPKLEEAAKYDNHVVVEECVDCIELETAVLGNDDIIVSRVGQIMPHGEFYTFESKYEDAESKTCIPAKVDEEIQEQMLFVPLRQLTDTD